MSSADLSIGIAVDSNVEQATKKTNAAFVSMEKQISDIGKKFSTAGKDIFLGFLAPMVILQTAMSFISDKLAEAKANAKEGLAILSQGKEGYAGTDVQKAAQYYNEVAANKLKAKQLEEGQQELAKSILESDSGQKYLAARQASNPKGEGFAGINKLALRKQLIEDPNERKILIDTWLRSPEGRAFIPELTGKDKASGTFKGPEGYGNIVGVGPNPVMQAMDAQLEEQRKQTSLLQNLVDKNPFTPIDFTKGSPLANPATQSLK